MTPSRMMRYQQVENKNRMKQIENRRNSNETVESSIREGDAWVFERIDRLDGKISSKRCKFCLCYLLTFRNKYTSKGWTESSLAHILLFAFSSPFGSLCPQILERAIFFPTQEPLRLIER